LSGQGFELPAQPEWLDADVLREVAGVAGVDEQITAGCLTRMLPAAIPIEQR
jgi:uncharacterized protein YidB (DUF937 family)